MSGADYEPHDSRDVTLRPNAPGKPSGWREAPGEQAPSEDLAPTDQRRVHGTAPGQGASADQDAGAEPVRQAHPFTAEEAAAATKLSPHTAPKPGES